jgi:two-component sensor histidine kinase
MSNGDAAADESKQAENLLASPELVRAFENDEFRQILDHIPIALLVAQSCEGTQRIVYANASLADICGRPLEQIVGTELTALNYFIAEGDASRTLGKAIAEDDDFLGIFWTQINERRVVAEAYVSTIDCEGEGESFSIAALVDISQRDQAERAENDKAATDKDMLMRELQHRVRNNLQLVIALIRIEARQFRRGEPVDFDRLAHRVEALSLLYSALSPETAESHLDLTHYIGQIAGAALQSNGPDGVRLELKLESCVVPVNVALSVGLVVNELITNAFKYAFSGRDGGKITVRCVRKDDECVVSVEDDGIGLPEGATWPVPGKIGDLMVRSLRENTKGHFAVETAPGKGMAATMRFAVPLH